MFLVNKTKLNKQNMKNKLLSLSEFACRIQYNAIEIGPTGSGVELSGFVDWF